VNPRLAARLACGVLLAGCAGGRPATPGPSPASAPGDQALYPSTYQRRPNPPVLIRNATILTAAGPELSRASVLFADGRIVAVGADVTPPDGAVIVDGSGKYVTPGLIDSHSHLGVYAAPATSAEADGNEATRPVTADVWAEHSFWPQDPQIPLAVAGGVTVIQALPGSANLIGGRSAVLRRQPDRRPLGGAPPRARAIGAGNEVSGRATGTQDRLR
jgi:imidazolonepropionase-like amidohydrolase